MKPRLPHARPAPEILLTAMRKRAPTSVRGPALGLTLGAVLAWGVTAAWAQPAAPAPAGPAVLPGSPCLQVEAAPPVHLSVGKSTVWRPAAPVRRVVLGNPEQAPAARSGPSESSADRTPRREAVARTGSELRPGVADVDVLLLSPREIVLQARTLGATNLVLADGLGHCTALDVVVGLDTSALQALLERLLPAEKEVRVTPAFDGVVLSGTVTDSEALARVTELAQAFLRSHDGIAQNPRLVNLLEVGAPQQVMLEVKVAEVSKALIDQIGVQVSGSRTRGQWTYTLLADFLSGGNGVLGAWVEIVTSHGGARPRAVAGWCAAGVRGLVVAATGNGSVHSALEHALAAAASRGVPVPRASRCAAGGIVQAQGAGQSAPALESAHHLTPAQARVELMLRLLAQRT